jgi:hypothetical protein
MKSRLPLYLVIAFLTVLDSYLLAHPNLLGKIGLFIYKIHFLKNFPTALLTVSVTLSVATVVVEVIRRLVKNGILRRGIGGFILFLFIVLAVFILVRTALDFSAWTASHTGNRFKYGAYLLPVLLLIIFCHALFGLPKAPGVTKQKEYEHDDH